MIKAKCGGASILAAHTASGVDASLPPHACHCPRCNNSNATAPDGCCKHRGGPIRAWPRCLIRHTSQVHFIRHTAAATPTDRIPCPECHTSAVASPGVRPPSLLQETLPLGVAAKGHAGTWGIPPRSNNWPQITWRAVQGAMRWPPEPKHLPHSVCLPLYAEDHGRAGCVDIHGL
jgi:hypothetical protein